MVANTTLTTRTATGRLRFKHLRILWWHRLEVHAEFRIGVYVGPFSQQSQVLSPERFVWKKLTGAALADLDMATCVRLADSVCQTANT